MTAKHQPSAAPPNPRRAAWRRVIRYTRLNRTSQTQPVKRPEVKTPQRSAAGEFGPQRRPPSFAAVGEMRSHRLAVSRTRLIFELLLRRSM
jgi:hypothetical protein